MRSKLLRGWAAAALLLAAHGPAASELDQIVERLRSVEPDFERAVDASGMKIELERATFEVEQGTLVPLVLSGEARAFEVVFVGAATLRVAPPDPVEAYQVALFTGSESADLDVRAAVLTLGDETRVAGWLGRQRVSAGESLREFVSEFLDSWLHDFERGGGGAEIALMKRLADDAPAVDYVGVAFESSRSEAGYYESNPWEAEAISFGSVRSLAAAEDDAGDGPPRRRGKRESSAGEDADEPDDDATDDEDAADLQRTQKTIWMAARRPGVGALDEPPGVEPASYRIELTFAGSPLRADGQATLDLVPNVDGLRFATLTVGSEVEVSEILDVDGAKLDFLRRHGRVHVLLPRPTAAGERLALEVRFGGELVRRLLARNTLKHTVLWHPHAGRRDLAVYDVTLRWPEPYELLAAGRVEAGGRSDGQRWERRVLDVPTRGFGFEIDEFEVRRVEIGHVEIAFGFSPHDVDLTEEIRTEVTKTVQAALLFYETHLGLLPIDDLAVSVTQRDFSQGLLGNLTLSSLALTHPVGFSANIADNRTPQERRLATIAHEMAHQWWGHVVGWESYRDQWLSEALADYSADRFMSRIAPDREDYLSRHGRMWRMALGAASREGRPLASLGPVVLGHRLGRNHSLAAYRAIVYDKGSAVFTSLAEQLGREPMWRMLGALAGAVQNRTVDTATFFGALERMSGRDLANFAEQYVYGVGMPSVFFEYRFLADGPGGWRVEGTALQLPTERAHFEVRRVDGQWDVVRVGEVEASLGGWTTVVPFRVTAVADAEGVPLGATAGRLTLQGERSDFTIPVPWRPGRFELDPEAQVLAEFHDARFHPKNHLRSIGERLLRLGREQEGLDHLERALAADVVTSAESGRPVEEIEAEGRLQDARTHLALARVRLDSGDVPAARDELRAAEKLIPDEGEFFLGERVALGARLDMRAGNYRWAFDRLWEYRAEHRRLRTDLMFDPTGVNAWLVDEAELQGLFAVAAFEVRGDLAEDALERAQAAGVDVSALTR